jgi:hypothetical protein
MLDWFKRRGAMARPQREVSAEPAKPQGRTMSGKYSLLYRYLEDRYANTVVLTFNEIEDLLGFTLPEQARLQQEWWTSAVKSVPESNYSDSWLLAHRSAVPNMLAKTVAFERLS